MSREIKFRAWDTKQKVLITPENARSFENKFGNDDDYYGYEWYPYYEFQEFAREIKSERYKVMQYTGLKDKDGLEIYEDDILKHNNGEILVVKWLDNEGRFFADKWYCLQITMSKCEIIGNIYENQELIDQ